MSQPRESARTTQRAHPSSRRQQLCKAIEAKQLIAFTYHGLRRVAEPHDYGVLNGIEQLLVYQVAGESRSQVFPDWRLVRVADIREFKVLKKHFPGSRFVPTGKHKRWDTLFIRVDAAASM